MVEAVTLQNREGLHTKEIDVEPKRSTLIRWQIIVQVAIIVHGSLMLLTIFKLEIRQSNFNGIFGYHEKMAKYKIICKQS